MRNTNYPLCRHETLLIFALIYKPFISEPPERNMTRKEIDNLIKSSEGQVQYALRNLRQILEQDKARGQEIRWTKLLISHKDLIEVLKRLKADDE